MQFDVAMGQFIADLKLVGSRVNNVHRVHRAKHQSITRLGIDYHSVLV